MTRLTTYHGTTTWTKFFILLLVLSPTILHWSFPIVTKHGVCFPMPPCVAWVVCYVFPGLSVGCHALSSQGSCCTGKKSSQLQSLKHWHFWRRWNISNCTLPEQISLLIQTINTVRHSGGNAFIWQIDEMKTQSGILLHLYY